MQTGIWGWAGRSNNFQGSDSYVHGPRKPRGVRLSALA